MKMKLQIKTLIKYKKEVLTIVFLNGQIYNPFISQIYTSFHKVVIKPKYDFWVH